MTWVSTTEDLRSTTSAFHLSGGFTLISWGSSECFFFFFSHFFWGFFGLLPSDYKKAAVWLVLEDSSSDGERCESMDKHWKINLKKKKKFCLKKIFLCSLVNTLSVSYSTFPSPENVPPKKTHLPLRPHPLCPGSNLLLMHLRRHVDRQKIPQTRPANFNFKHTPYRE